MPEPAVVVGAASQLASWEMRVVWPELKLGASPARNAETCTAVNTFHRIDFIVMRPLLKKTLRTCAFHKLVQMDAECRDESRSIGLELSRPLGRIRRQKRHHACRGLARRRTLIVIKALISWPDLDFEAGPA